MPDSQSIAAPTFAIQARRGADQSPAPELLSPPLTPAPPSTPVTAYAAALVTMDAWSRAGRPCNLVPLGDNGKPMRPWARADAPRTPSTPLGAALVMAGFSHPSGPVYPDGSFGTGWDAATADPDQLEADVSWPRAVACGVNLDRANLVVIDADGPGGEAEMMRLCGVADRDELAALTFTVQSRRGPQAWFRRPECLAGDRASWVYSPKRPAEALAPDLDTVCGIGRALDHKKRWLSSPERIAACPPMLAAALAAMVEAKRDREAEQAEAAARNAEQAEAAWQRWTAEHANATERSAAYASALVEGLAADVAAIPDGARNVRGSAINYGAGRRVAADWNELDETTAAAALMRGYQANGYAREVGEAACLRWVLRGIRAGMDNPAPPPADRAPAAIPLPRSAELEPRQVRALLGRLADARKLAKESGARGQAIATRKDLGAAIAQALLDANRDSVRLGSIELSERIGCLPSTVNRHREAVAEAFGYTVEVGGIDADGRPTATVWRLGGPNKPQFAQGTPTTENALDDSLTDRAADTLCKLTNNGGELARGLRARGPRPDPAAVRPDPAPARPHLSRTGCNIAAALERLGQADVAELAEAEDCGLETARRALETIVAAGAAARDDAVAGRGRPRAVYVWLGWPAAVAAKLCAAGARAINRVRVEAERFREQVAAARSMAERLARPFVEVWQRIRRQDRSNRDRELAAASEDERGRPGSCDSRPWVDDVRLWADYLLSDWAPPTPPAAVDPEPPAWATIRLPLAVQA